jgi:iron complex outermembrane recepter protein
VTLPTRMPQPVTQSPAAISVITADDIAHSGYINIWDLLRNQPGIDVFQISGNLVGVAARGFNGVFSEKLQVLVDGRTIFDPLNNSAFFQDSPILLEDIERIEIMRGPNSVLYGYNSFNGVINIVTKVPGKTKGILTKMTVGTHSTQHYFSRVGESIGKLDYRLSYSKDNTQGLGTHDGKETVDGSRFNTVNWRSTYTVADDKNIEFFAGSKLGIAGQQEAISAVDDKHHADYQQLKYNQRLSDNSAFFVQLFRNNLAKDFGYSADNQTNLIGYKQYDFEFQHNFKPFDYHAIVWGSGWRRNEGRNYALFDPYGWYHDTILRSFVQDTITITDTLTYYSGVEWSQNNYTGSDWSTRQTAMYNLFDDHFLRATFAQAYHAFGFFQYEENLGPGATGNPNPQSERINSYGIGYKGSFLNKKISFAVECFYNDIHKIWAALTSSAPGSPSFANINNAEATGVETSLEYKPWSWLKTYANHSYLNVNDKMGLWKHQDPKHKVNIGARVSLRETYLPDYIDAKLGYVGRLKVVDNATMIPVKQYYKLDLKVAKKFFKDAMEAALTGLNLWSPRHFEYANRVRINRQILGSISIAF